MTTLGITILAIIIKRTCAHILKNVEHNGPWVNKKCYSNSIRIPCLLLLKKGPEPNMLASLQA